MSNIPLSNLEVENKTLLPRLLARMEKVLSHGKFILGPEVEELEAALAQYTGTAHCITCSSGTTALLMALMALRIGRGDEVILPAFTFAAPLEMVLLLGATPVLADIDPESWTLSPAAAARKITPKTRAIIGVSLFGHPAACDELHDLARRGVTVIEDMAQSFGATLRGKQSGNLSPLACASFFPTKPLGGFGDGGAVFTSDDKLATALRQIRDHGQSGKYQHAQLGLNGRLDTLSCAFLLEKLAVFPEALKRRQEVAARYTQALQPLSNRIQLPLARKEAVSSWAQYTILLENREAAVRHLSAAGIATSIHYPSTLQKQPAFAGQLDQTSSCPIAEKVAEQCLSLPCYSSLSHAQQGQVCESLIQFIS